MGVATDRGFGRSHKLLAVGMLAFDTHRFRDRISQIDSGKQARSLLLRQMSPHIRFSTVSVGTGSVMGRDQSNGQPKGASPRMSGVSS